MILVENPSPRAEQWDDLFIKLQEVLANFGKIAPTAEAEFWLVDDDWGGHHHKLEVIKAGSWSDSARQAVSEVLATSHPNWGVYVDFEAGSEREDIIVYADGVETTPRWP
jgi:hypothetical protein